MRFTDYIKLSFKNLSRQRARTILTVIAIVIGSMSVIVMLTLVISAKKALINQLESIGAFTLVTVTGSENMDGGGGLLSTGNGDSSDGKKLDDTVLSDLKKIENVKAATPTANLWAKSMKIEDHDKKTWPNLLAYDVESNVFDIPVTYGRNLQKGDMDKVVIGTQLLKKLKYDKDPKDVVGKNMILILDGNNTPDWGPEPEKPPANADKEYWESLEKKTKEIKLEIVGVTSGGMDSEQSYITMDFARKMQTQVRWEWDEEANKKYQEEQDAKRQQEKFGSGNTDFKNENPNFMKLTKEDEIAKRGYGAIILKADNTNNVKAIGEAVEKLGYSVTTAQDMLDEIGKIFTMLGILAGTIGGISLFVAAIGIINTMIMATYERTREIGVMRACGARRKTIRRMFTVEAALLGFFGGLVGLTLSFGLGKIGNIVAGRIAVSENVPIENFISFPWWLIASVIAFTTFVGLISGVYPAHRAAKLDPVEALRYE